MPTPLLLLCSLHLLTAITTTTTTTSTAAAASPTDSELLLSFKTTLQNPNTNVFTTWVSTKSPCNFSGITCNSQSSVSEIDLSNQELTGVLSLDPICQLPSLQKLSLGFNSLSGQVPESLNNCSKLQYLDLGNNFFTGDFPGIPGLTDLQYLYLNGSGFSGNFPFRSLSNMTSLMVLSIGDNAFSPFTFPVEVVELKSLQWLYLSNCSLTGKIPPAIGNVSDLVHLELQFNDLSGEIPPEIGQLKKLRMLELYEDNLSGKLPFGFRNLTSLEYFDASTNNLEGDLSELSYLNNIVSIQLFENRFTGEIPAEFGQFTRLVNLSLYTNYLSGTLPPQLGSWSDFDYIDVTGNNFTGPIPPDLCKKGTMKRLLMLQNNFTGEIPTSYETCTTLLRFRVSNNSLSGKVPAKLWGLPNLNIIDIEFNQLEGPITSDIGNAKNLGQLFVGNNRLSGEIPDQISGAASLVAIELKDNQFTGKIPDTIGGLKYLSSLQLENNAFSGSIPESLGSCESLSDLNIAHNSLTGEIPSSLGTLPTLNSLNLSDNSLSGQIPNSLSKLKLSLLDLSNNRLTGQIPEGLALEAYNVSFAGNPGLCSQSINSFMRCTKDSTTSKALIAGLTVGLTLLFVSIAWSMYKKNRGNKNTRSWKEESWDVKSFQTLSFNEDAILDSIKEENLIGKGGSGNVYKVKLASGKELAVKHLWTNTDSDGLKRSSTSSPMLPKQRGSKSKEFDAEVRTLSSVRHVNVVKLYCSITSQDSSLLVYEYLPNGSLWDRLHVSQKTSLDWITRYEIAVGAAKGLEYLHHGCQRPVIHRDVKSSNILLDEFLKPRIADFGLAKVVQGSRSKDSTHIVAGTHGYIAPEYGYTHKVNEKSDVYSFGVVLMELVSGKRPIEPEFGENKDIVGWVGSNLRSKESVLTRIVDSKILQGFKEDAMKVLRIAILCTARLPALRPTMKSVVQMLEEAEPQKLVAVVVSKDNGI